MASSKHTCCVFIPLELGCIIAAVVLSLLTVIEFAIFAMYFTEFYETQKAIYMLSIFAIIIENPLFWTGTLKGTRLPLYMFIVFTGVFTTANLICHYVLYYFLYGIDYYKQTSTLRIIFRAFFFVFQYFMIYLSYLRCMDIKEKHQQYYEYNLGYRDTVRFGSYNSEIYGM